MSHGNECRPSLHCIAVPVSLRVRGYQRRCWAGDVIHSSLWIVPVPSTSSVNMFESHVISEDLFFYLYRRACRPRKVILKCFPCIFYRFFKRVYPVFKKILFWLPFLWKLHICFWLTSVNLCSNLCHDLGSVKEGYQKNRLLRRCMTTKDALKCRGDVSVLLIYYILYILFLPTHFGTCQLVSNVHPAKNTILLTLSNTFIKVSAISIRHNPDYYKPESHYFTIASPGSLNNCQFTCAWPNRQLTHLN